jgi:uncharacterized integral membrane protein
MTIQGNNTNDYPGDSQSPRHLFRYITLIIIALLLVIFAIQNSHEVTINLWFWEFRTSLALALVICIILGFVLSLIYFYPYKRTKKNRMKENYPADKPSVKSRYSDNL